MSQAVVEQVVGKMLLDAKFRAAVAADKAKALAEYDLTDAEREIFSHVDPADFASVSNKLDQRVSKAYPWKW